MSVITKFLKLFQYEPEKDADSTFNISLALNENWDKIDNACAALNTGKAAADHTHTAAQVGADTAGAAQMVQTRLQQHTADKANPHAVTAEQIGAVPANEASEFNFVKHIINTLNIDKAYDHNYVCGFSLQEGNGTFPVQDWLNITNFCCGHFVSQTAITCQNQGAPPRSWIRQRYITPEAPWSAWREQSFADHSHSFNTSEITGTLPIAKGGTGATTAAGVRANLAIASPVTATLSLSAASWVLVGGVYQQTVACSVAQTNMKMRPLISLNKPTDLASAKLQSEAFALIERADTGSGNVTFVCGTEKPQVTFSVFFDGGIA